MGRKTVGAPTLPLNSALVWSPSLKRRPLPHAPSHSIPLYRIGKYRSGQTHLLRNLAESRRLRKNVKSILLGSIRTLCRASSFRWGLSFFSAARLPILSYVSLTGGCSFGARGRGSYNGLASDYPNHGWLGLCPIEKTSRESLACQTWWLTKRGRGWWFVAVDAPRFVWATGSVPLRSEPLVGQAEISFFRSTSTRNQLSKRVPSATNERPAFPFNTPLDATPVLTEVTPVVENTTPE